MLYLVGLIAAVVMIWLWFRGDIFAAAIVWLVLAIPGWVAAAFLFSANVPDGMRLAVGLLWVAVAAVFAALPAWCQRNPSRRPQA